MNTQTELQEKTADALQDLLTRAYDAEQGFQHAADAVENPRLKTLFNEYAEQRRRFGHDLKAQIRSNGESPDKGASMVGKLHQFWIDLRGKVSGGSEADLIEECRRGEETTLEDYGDYAADMEISEVARQLISSQLEEIRGIYARLTSMENKAAAMDAASH